MIATPGCHVTAATLALAPLVEAGVIEPTGVIVNSITGVSGAGRALKHSSMFCTVDEDVKAYGLARPSPHARDRAGDRCAGAVHAAPRADESGSAGDLLRQAQGQRHDCVVAGNTRRPVQR